MVKNQNKNSKEVKIAKMPTQLIHMSESTYPFGESGDHDPSNRVLIKQTIPKSSSNFTQILRVAKIAKKLSQNKIFVKLQTIMEEQDSVCLLYEYVPIKVSKYVKAMDEKFLKQYRQQLYEIADLLAENRIIANVEMANMGLNEKYEAKYFLGMSFVQKKQVNMYELKNDYIQQIKRTFAPFLTSTALVSPKKSSKNLVKVDNRLSDTQQMQNVSSYIDSNNNLVKTRKHQSIYYQKDKDKEVKHRKQSYMSSVSNLRLNNLYRRINEIQLQVCNTRSPNKTGFKFAIEGREFTSKSSIDNKKAIDGGQRVNGNNRALGNGSGRNGGGVNHVSSHNNSNGNSMAMVAKNGNYGSRYPEYENQEDYEEEQMSQYDDYEKSIRSNRPNRYAVVKNTLEMSAHTKPTDKKQYKKFSTQFPSLSDFEQPLMALTSALRISANGLDKQEKKVNKKIQMFKEREYSQMKSVSGNTNYMRDFMSVLEEESSTNQRTSKHNENENDECQQGEYNRPPNIKMASQLSIEDMEFQPLSSQPLQKQARMPQYSQQAITTYSHAQLPSNNKPPVSPLTQYNQTPPDPHQNRTIKTKPSIEQNLSTVDIHNRVKGVIENSKKLIQKLKEKAKKNV